MKKLAVLALAPLLLPGCLLLAIPAVVAIAVSQNRDPVSIQNGVATREYTVSFDRAWAGVESALRAREVVTEPATRTADTASLRGRTKEGEPVEITAEHINVVIRISIRVGQTDTPENRKTAKAIHQKIDEDFCVVRRHYGQNFTPVWEAGQKVVPPDNKIQPDNNLGQIQGKRADGTPVVITIQKVDTSRTRITIEVGATANLETQQQAVDLARAISKALGIKSEEGD